MSTGTSEPLSGAFGLVSWSVTDTLIVAEVHLLSFVDRSRPQHLYFPSSTVVAKSILIVDVNFF